MCLPAKILWSEGLFLRPPRSHATALADAVPSHVKVGAPDDVEQCALSAMPSVKLAHAAQVPPAIPARPGTCYFVLENRGVLYERMLKG